MTMAVGARVSGSGLTVGRVKAGEGTDEPKAIVRFLKELDSACFMYIGRPRRLDKWLGSDLRMFPTVVR